jgi:hypothetical protein
VPPPRAPAAHPRVDHPISITPACQHRSGTLAARQRTVDSSSRPAGGDGSRRLLSNRQVWACGPVGYRWDRLSRWRASSSSGAAVPIRLAYRSKRAHTAKAPVPRARIKVHAFLAEHRLRLFPDEMFADLFPTCRGRPSVPADVVATMMVLQALEERSDREACRALQTDLAWKAATGTAVTDEAFHPTVLTLWRHKPTIHAVTTIEPRNALAQQSPRPRLRCSRPTTDTCGFTKCCRCFRKATYRPKIELMSESARPNPTPMPTPDDID